MRMTLKRPCPVCGGTPELHCNAENRIYYLQYRFFVMCPNCGSQTCTHDDDDDALDEFYVDMDIRPVEA